MNITEEMQKCAIWKNLQSNERPQDTRPVPSSSSSKRYVVGTEDLHNIKLMSQTVLYIGGS